MAEPVEDNVIPFAESSPADDLQIEMFGESDVLIGDPTLDDIPLEPEVEFDANLAEVIDKKQLDRKAADLIGYFESDKDARAEWEQRSIRRNRGTYAYEDDDLI